MELSEFLLARIAEDEEAARESHYEGQHWLTEEEGVYRWPDDELVDMADRKADARHIARHDPARVLAECEAKRRIVEEHEKNRGRIEANASDHTKASASGDLSALPTLRSAGWDLGGRDWALEVTLRLLALPYADHPDYDEAWRP